MFSARRPRRVVRGLGRAFLYLSIYLVTWGSTAFLVSLSPGLSGPTPSLTRLMASNAETNIAKALELKAQGNEAFKAAEYKQAMIHYHQVCHSRHTPRPRLLGG